MAQAPQQGLFHKFNQIINYLNQYLIIAGFIYISKRNIQKLNLEYFKFALVNLIILFACIAIPYLGKSLNMTRIYHITLITLSPFFILGSLWTLRLLVGKVNAIFKYKFKINPYKIISIYIVLFFLFQIGAIYYITENTKSISLGNQNYTYNEYEMTSVLWLKETKENNNIYADEQMWLLIKEKINLGFDKILSNQSAANLDKRGYIFFGSRNLIEDKVQLTDRDVINVNKRNINADNLTFDKNQIYHNGNSGIFTT